MKFDDVNKLLSAGFTADEIRGMLSETAENHTDQTGSGADPEPEQLPEAAAGTPAATADAAIKALTESVQALQATVKEMQKANISAAEQDKPQAPSAETAIKNFLSRM